MKGELLAVVILAALGNTASLAIDPGRAMSQYVREHWGAEQGFPHGPVYAITQTADGYLWIGTDEGLVRFDGVQFQVIRNQPGLVKLNGVIGLAPDKGGDLWVRLRNWTLLRYHDGSIFNPFSGTGPVSNALALANGRSGEMIAAPTQQGVFTFGKAQLQPLAKASGIPRSPILSIAETGDGSYWIGTRGAGLFRLKDGTTVPLFAGLPDPKVNCLLADGPRGLWIGTDSGLVRWDGSKLTSQGAPEELKHSQILALGKDRDANLWIGTDSGDVFRLSTAGLAALDQTRSEPGIAITALFEDREGSIWIGSANGLERLRDSPFVTYSVPEGVPTDGSNPVFVDGADRMWFAPVSGGLWWWKDGEHGSVPQQTLNNDIIYSITGGGNGLWLGRQRGGLTHLDTSSQSFSAKTWTAKDGLAQNSVYSVYQDEQGSVWAGTLSGGVSKWDGTQFKTYTVADGLASNTVVAILQVGSFMWFATPNGASLLSRGKWRTFQVADGLPSGNVNCLLKDKSDLLWAGTAAGLAHWKDGRFHSPAKAPALLRDQILGIAEDNFGWLWVSTPNHVFRVKREAVLENNVTGESVVEYGLADGLRGVDGVKRQYSVWADRKGKIWFSLNRGISMVDPARLSGSAHAANPILQSVTADGAELGRSGHLRIPFGQQRIVFHYAGLSLSLPDRERFRYRLEAFDRDWSKVLPDRQAEYTNLGPGTYRFRVLASNPDGIWSTKDAAVDFTVDPAYWQTWWFRSGLLLLGAVAVTAVYRLRLSQLTARLNMRFEERLAERTRIAQELHDTLLQGFLSASMQLHVAANGIPPESPAKASVLKTLELIKRVTEEGRNAVRGLRATRTTSLDLEDAFSRIEAEISPADHPVAFRVLSRGECAPLHPILRDEVYRIGREAILNAFRHAGAGKIEAELSYSSQALRLTVRDDGCGIEPQTLRAGRDGHWGLSGMRERADRIGARLRLCSNPQGGTEVELTVPGSIVFQSRSREKVK